MFRATYLGHHGWLFEGARGRILVDPILTARWGFTDAVELRLWPPTRVDLARFPPIDAVVITHEHEGHFEIPSLHAIDRRVPVYLPERSSVATRAFLGEMGFEVHASRPEQPIVAGDLELTPMSADQVRARADEWDVLPFLVRDTGGDGSLFTQVDMRANDSMWRIAKERLPRPGLWSYTNNHNQWDFQFAYQYPDAHNLYRISRDILALHRAMCDGWAAPEALLVAGGGFVFGGELAWVNRHAFPMSNREVAESLSLLAPGQRVHSPVPGQGLVMRGGKLVEVEPERPFVAALPEAEWPARAGEPTPWLADYPPITGRRELDGAEVDALGEELDRFAGHLYGSLQFRYLYSTPIGDCKGKKPAIALMLRDGDGVYVYEYVPQGCRFVQVAVSDPVGEYLAVYECWASDLLAVLRAEIASTALLFARSRHWNASPERFGLAIDLPLVEYAHPLRHPERFGALYRRILARLPAPEARIGRRSP